jgi:diadenosine tetraphosphate (Ap4A) HIT family hydrolase
MDCPLCNGDGGLVVARTPRFRVVRVLDEPAHPAFYRLIWNTHVAEFSDLADTDRHACMDAVTEIERVLRSLLAPTKVNLASLGNVVPHLHWHVIARFSEPFPRAHLGRGAPRGVAARAAAGGRGRGAGAGVQRLSSATRGTPLAAAAVRVLRGWSGSMKSTTKR